LAGIPVYAQPGRGGGWSLVGGSRTDLSGLTAAEARTLFLVAGPSSTVAPEAKAALRKLVQALPATFRADAEAAASAVVIDPARWGSAAAPPPRHLEALQSAVIDGVQVHLAYADRRRSRTERTVHPLGLVEKRAVWYLIAGTDAGLRTFRVARVRSVTVTDAPVHRPEGFDLASAWESTVALVEEQLALVTAVVRIPAMAQPWLRELFGRRLGVRKYLAGGRIEVEVAGAGAEQIAQLVAGWGRDLEVVSPPAVRDHLCRIGAELVAQNSPVAGASGP
jgi:predicted DNA-binding transcriptional regulator YafY